MFQFYFFSCYSLYLIFDSDRDFWSIGYRFLWIILKYINKIVFFYDEIKHEKKKIVFFFF